MAEQIVDCLAKENERLQIENEQLKHENKSLSSTCQALARNVDDLEEKTARQPIDSINHDLSRLRLEASGQLEEVHNQLHSANEEIYHLQRKCEEQNAALEAQERTISDLRRQAQGFGGNSQHVAVDEIWKQCQEQMSEEKRGHRESLQAVRKELLHRNQEIESYQAQLKIYMDDFKAESEERNAAELKVKKLEEELSLTKELLNQFSNRNMSAAAKRREEAVGRIRREYYGNGMSSSSSYQPMFRNRGGGIVVCDGEDETPLGEDEDIIDSLVEPDSHMGDSPVPLSNSSDLQCPKCSRGYSIQQHSDFLEHIDTCCN